MEERYRMYITDGYEIGSFMHFFKIPWAFVKISKSSNVHVCYILWHTLYYGYSQPNLYFVVLKFERKTIYKRKK